jgi:hypothetical protein
LHLLFIFVRIEEQIRLRLLDSRRPLVAFTVPLVRRLAAKTHRMRPDLHPFRYLIAFLLITVVSGVAFSLYFFTYRDGVVTDQSGNRFLCRRVTAIFSASSTENVIQSAVASVNGRVRRVIPELRAYELSLSAPCSAVGVWRALDTLMDQPGVESAEPVYMGEFY